MHHLNDKNNVKFEFENNLENNKKYGRHTSLSVHIFYSNIGKSVFMIEFFFLPNTDH